MSQEHSLFCQCFKIVNKIGHFAVESESQTSSSSPSPKGRARRVEPEGSSPRGSPSHESYKSENIVEEGHYKCYRLPAVYSID